VTHVSREKKRNAVARAILLGAAVKCYRRSTHEQECPRRPSSQLGPGASGTKWHTVTPRAELATNTGRNRRASPPLSQVIARYRAIAPPLLPSFEGSILSPSAIPVPLHVPLRTVVLSLCHQPALGNEELRIRLSWWLNLSFQMDHRNRSSRSTCSLAPESMQFEGERGSAYAEPRPTCT